MMMICNGFDIQDFENMPKIQKPAPEFSADAIVDGAIKKVSLSDYKGKYVVLFFYPLDWTFVCPTEIIAFSDAAAKFKAANCELVGCSVDSVYSHLQWVKTDRKKGGLGGCNVPLLADVSHKIGNDYDVLLEDGVALRGAFIIDGKGILRSMIVNDLPVGRNPDEILRLVQAFQFTDVHGEVCPASWTPGAKSMKADPVGSLEYFGSS